MKYGFVYLWRDRKHNRYYLGRHWGTIEDNYICSSRMMRQSYNRRPEDFKRRILSIVSTKEKLIIEEQRFLNMIKKNELGTRYYNKILNANSPSTLGYRHSEETKTKIGNANRGRKITHSQKWKDTMFGRVQSDEEKEKRAQKLRGLKRTDEFKLRMSSPKEKVICPHCSKIGGLAIMKRWHFDNCNKYKNKE